MDTTWIVLKNSNPRLPSITINTVIEGAGLPSGSEILWEGSALNRGEAWEKALKANPSGLKDAPLPTGDSINVFSRVRPKRKTPSRRQKKAKVSSATTAEVLLTFFHARPGQTFTAREACDQLGVKRGTGTSRINELRKAGLLEAQGEPMRYQIVEGLTTKDCLVAYKKFNQDRRRGAKGERIRSLVLDFVQAQGDEGATSEEIEDFVLKTTASDAKVFLRHSIASRISEMKRFQYLLPHPQGKTREGKRRGEILLAGPLAGLILWLRRYPDPQEDLTEVVKAIEAVRKAKGGIWV